MNTCTKFLYSVLNLVSLVRILGVDVERRHTHSLSDILNQQQNTAKACVYDNAFDTVSC